MQLRILFRKFFVFVAKLVNFVLLFDINFIDFLLVNGRKVRVKGGGSRANFALGHLSGDGSTVIVYLEHQLDVVSQLRDGSIAGIFHLHKFLLLQFRVLAELDFMDVNCRFLFVLSDDEHLKKDLFLEIGRTFGRRISWYSSYLVEGIVHEFDVGIEGLLGTASKVIGFRNPVLFTGQFE